MPVEDYEELDLTGMNVDTVGHHFDILEAKFGAGRRRGARVGSSWGEQRFALSAGVLPDHVDYGSLINGDPRFVYYYEFWIARMQAGNEPFLIDWRGKKFTVVFENHDFEYETFTSDLFAGGVFLEQCAVEGESYEADGSVTPTV